MNKLYERFFKNSLSLYDVISIQVIVVLAAFYNWFLLVLLFPNMVFSVRMAEKCTKE
jgi:hypothetical protein